MAAIAERLTEIHQLMENAEGYFTDAEFREDPETKRVRYFQSMSSSLRAITQQNAILIDLMARQAGEDLSAE
jgi:hypothetical protein